MLILFSIATWLNFIFGLFNHNKANLTSAADEIKIKPTQNFTISGDGRGEAWKTAPWYILPQRGGSPQKETRFKVMYSPTGLYFLFNCQDEVITATKQADFEQLWLEDVVEVFLWPDTSQTIYFEYEISPLNYELPILVPNINGKFLGWLPWQYEGNRKIKHLTSVTGGKKISGGAIKSWQAEFFIPYTLLAPLQNNPPKAGTIWQGNFYRLDYDQPKPVVWSWQKTDKSFHEFKKFGRLVFE